MKQIWKFDLPLQNEASVVMPKGTKVLSVGASGNGLVVWGEVEVSSDTEDRVFHVFGTGHVLVPPLGPFVGTVQAPPFVWHVYQAAL